MVRFDLNNEMALDSLDLERMLERDGLKDVYINPDLIGDNIISFHISYFDHFLSEEEYIAQEFVCYSDVKKLDSQEKRNYFELLMNRFLSIYAAIFKLNNGRVYIEGRGSSIEITDDLLYYSRCIIDGLKENPLCSIVFPNIKITIDLGYDLTHRVLTFHDNDKVAETIKEITRNQFLHII